MSWPSPDCLLLVAIAIPLAAAVLIPVFGKWPNLRETITLTAAVLLCVTIVALLGPVMGGARPQWTGIEVLPDIPFAFRLEPLGMLFALVASSLWIVNSIYSIGYMRAHDEPRQTTYYACFAVALASTMGVAFAENLFTLFLAYEALTLSTYPLVTHHRDREAMASGRLYLVLLLGTSMVLFLPAIVGTYVLAGTTDFTVGGILGGKADATTLMVLLGLYVFGIGKAGLIPVHFWLPAAMVAPTPVSALLHAVAVVKAGVFCVVKVVVYIFGLKTLSETGAANWLTYEAAFSIILASLVALAKDNLKARLAYSTVSQLAYVVLGASLANPAGIIGGSMQIAMHAMGKITLFFCAGAIFVATHLTKVSELDGLGRKMPWTFAAFLIASLSVIGLPPFGGTWVKWWLMTGALDAGEIAIVVVLLISSLLSVGYLLPVAARALFLPPRAESGQETAKAEDNEALERRHWLVVLPLVLTAIGTVVLFFYADRIEDLIRPIVAMEDVR
jgi:multicomponent Na+:H+ antiporter subunit D